MEITDKNLCGSCTNIGCEFQSGIVRTKCTFYMPPHLEPDNCGNYVVQNSTTKNDLGVDSISRDEVKYYIQAHIHEIITESGIDKNAHTNRVLRDLLYGVDTLPSVTPQFSSELEKNSKKLENPATKNNLGVDCISRADAIRVASGYCHPSNVVKELAKLPSAPQETQTFEWCTDCKEYDQEKHCCHRWSNVIRDTVEEMKQEYIEREVLDKIRAEIDTYLEIEGFGSEYRNDVKKIIDKYKGEGSDKE